MLLPDEPYLGLASFRFLDQHIFGGRANEIKRLRIMLFEYRGSLLYGPSGIGKSSLIEAGLIPHLLVQGLFSPIVLRVNPKYESTFIISRLNNATKDSGFHPCIFDHLIPKDGTQEASTINVSLEDFKKTITTLGEDYLQALNVDPHAKPTQIPVLIFDQFEEYVTLFEKKHADVIDLQNKIKEFLTVCYYTPHFPIKLLFTFREDYFTRLGKLFRSFPNIKDNYYHLEPLNKTLLKEIVNKPFDSAEKLAHYDAFPQDVRDVLVESLEKYYDVGNVDLTEVQIVCLYLYQLSPQVDRLKHLKEVTISTMLKSFYKKLLDDLKDEKNSIAIDILSLLVLNEKTRNIIYRDQIITQLTDIYKNKQSVEDVLKKLETGLKLIRLENRQDGEYYEIISEAIIPYINNTKIEKFNKDFLKTKKKSRRDTFVLVTGLALMATALTYILYLNHLEEQRLQAVKVIKATELWYEKIPTDSLRELVVNDLYKFRKEDDQQNYNTFKNSIELASKAYVYRDNSDNNAALSIAYLAYKNDKNNITKGIFSDFIKNTVMPDTLSVKDGKIKRISIGFTDQCFLHILNENKKYEVKALTNGKFAQETNLVDDTKELPSFLKIYGGVNNYYLFYTSDRWFTLNDKLIPIRAQSAAKKIIYAWSIQKNSFILLFDDGTYSQFKVNNDTVIKILDAKKPLIGKSFKLQVDFPFTNVNYVQLFINSKKQQHIRKIILKIIVKKDVQELVTDGGVTDPIYDLLDINNNGYRLLKNIKDKKLYISKNSFFKPLQGRNYAVMSQRGDTIISNIYSKAYITHITKQRKPQIELDSITNDLPLLFIPHVSPHNSNYVFYVKSQSYLTYNNKSKRRFFLFVPFNGDEEFLNDSTYTCYLGGTMYLYRLKAPINNDVSSFIAKYRPLIEQYITKNDELTNIISKGNP